MKHTCHWPGCKREVAPKFWGCRPHWLQLPLAIRNEIGRAYVRGQEITKLPSARYIGAFNDARNWIKEQGARLPAISPESSHVP